MTPPTCDRWRYWSARGSQNFQNVSSYPDWAALSPFGASKMADLCSPTGAPDGLFFCLNYKLGECQT